jgi:hypothetical protein
MPETAPEPIVVLVHGAFAESASWGSTLAQPDRVADTILAAVRG